MLFGDRRGLMLAFRDSESEGKDECYGEGEHEGAFLQEEKR